MDQGALRWQSIETVPKDGTYVLLYDPEVPDWAGNMEVGAWFGGNEDHACFWSAGGPNGGLELERPFTHWMPLPEPPDLTVRIDPTDGTTRSFNGGA